MNVSPGSGSSWNRPGHPSVPSPDLGRPSPWRGLLRRNASAVGRGLLLYYAFSLGLQYVLAFFRRAFPSFDIAMRGLGGVELALFNGVVTIVSMLFPILVMLLLLDIPLEVALPLRKVRSRLLVPALLCCLGVSVVGVQLSSLITALLAATVGRVPVMPYYPAPFGVAETVLYFVQMAVLPALLEEILFRGVVMQSLRRFGDGFALVVSAILFAGLHGNLVQAPNALLSGLLLGYFALITGSLLAPMAMHFLNNALTAGINIAMLHLPPEYYEVLNFAVLPVYFGLGFLGIALMILLNKGFRPLADRECGMGLGERYFAFFTSPMILLLLALMLYVILLNFR